MEGSLQAHRIQGQPAGANVLVGPQQVGRTVGLHAVALAKVVVGIRKGLVGTCHRLGRTHSGDAQGHALGACRVDHVQQWRWDGRAGGEVDQVKATAYVVEQEVVGTQTDVARRRAVGWAVGEQGIVVATAVEQGVGVFVRPRGAPVVQRGAQSLA